MSYLKEYNAEFNDSSDSLYSGDTVYDEKYHGSIDDIHLMSDESKRLKVDEFAKKDSINQHNLLLKIDFHVVPPFAIVFFLAYLNRNFGLLQIEEIYSSLGITQLQFFMSYVAFFIPYIIGQFFSNNLLRFIKPHGLLFLGVLLCGATNLGTGFVKNYRTFVGCQFLHGLFQSSTEATIFYILAHYYSKRESLPRFSAIYSTSCLAGVFATFIAYIVDLKIVDKVNLTEGWRYLLIIIGAFTIGMSVIVFFTVPDFPEGAGFLTDKESVFLIRKLDIYNGKSGYEVKSTFGDIFKMIYDPVILIPALASIGIAYVTLAYSLFQPVFVLQVIGVSVSHSNEYSIFPWITAFVWSNLGTYFYNKWSNRYRCGFFFFNVVLTIIGGIMMYSVQSSTLPDNLKYGGCFLCAMGAFTAAPILICWSSTNLGGHLRKSVGIALQISCSSIGGLIAIFAFYDDDERYQRGFFVGFAAIILSVVCVVTYLLVIRWANKRKRTQKYKQEFFAKSGIQKLILGDKNPSIDYLY